MFILVSSFRVVIVCESLNHLLDSSFLRVPNLTSYDSAPPPDTPLPRDSSNRLSPEGRTSPPFHMCSVRLHCLSKLLSKSILAEFDFRTLFLNLAPCEVKCVSVRLINYPSGQRLFYWSAVSCILRFYCNVCKLCSKCCYCLKN